MKRPRKPEPPSGGEFAQVAVPGPHRELFTYRIPETMDALAKAGHRVLVPFGRRQLVGVVWERIDAPPAHVPEEKIRPIADVLDSHPIIDAGAARLCEWAARYYRASIGELARLAGPPGAGWASGPEQIRLSLPAEGELVDIASLPAGAREVYYAALEMLVDTEGLISVAKLGRKAGREALHSRLRLLERAGALSIEWERPSSGATGREIWKWSALEIPGDEREALETRAAKQAEVYVRSPHVGRAMQVNSTYRARRPRSRRCWKKATSPAKKKRRFEVPGSVSKRSRRKSRATSSPARRRARCRASRNCSAPRTSQPPCSGA